MDTGYNNQTKDRSSGTNRIAKQVNGEDSISTKRDFLNSVFDQKMPSSDRFIWSNPEDKANSRCTLKDDAKATYFDKETGKHVECTGKEFNQRLRNLYGTDSVQYKSKEPDFSPFEQEFSKEKMNSYLSEKYGNNHGKTVMSSAPGHVEVSKISTDRKETQREAMQKISEKTGLDTNEIKAYMSSKGITWHECGDGKTVRAVPTEVNSVYGHTGGIGLAKDMHAVGTVFKNDKTGDKGKDGNAVLAKEWANDHKNEIRTVKQANEKKNSISRATRKDPTREGSSIKTNAISKASRKDPTREGSGIKTNAISKATNRVEKQTASSPVSIKQKERGETQSHTRA